MKKDADIELATANISNLRKEDVILASYPGSGSSLLGGILIELGIDYIEGYQEKINSDQMATDTVNPMWRSHWPQLATKYDKKMIGLRAFKTHFYPISFKDSAPTKSILLIRDARDAVISYYNWRKNFSDETGTLYDFISRDGYYGKKPFDDWAEYIDAWELWGQNNDLLIVRYEDLKFYPETTIPKILLFLNIKPDSHKISLAIKNTALTKIQAEEAQTINDTTKRIFRKGLVGEWRSVLSDNIFPFIKQNTLQKLFRFGYELKYVDIKNYKNTYILTNDPEYILPESVILHTPVDIASLGSIQGCVYLSSTNLELTRCVQHICEVRELKLSLL